MTTRLAQSLIVPALLLIHAGLLAWLAVRHSPTFDETAHLPAGISHWEFGRFDLYRVNPPLVRLVAALPLRLMNPQTDWSRYDAAPGARSEFAVGADFMDANGPHSFWLFTVARWACIPFSLCGAYVCYRWARELYGFLAGLLALVLWCFCPNILGNAQTIQPDAAAAAMAVSAMYVFWKWCQRPSWAAALAAGFLMGLALLTKLTLILLLPLLVVLWALQRWPGRLTFNLHRFRAELVQIAAVLLLGIYILNLGYFFQGTFKTLGDYSFASSFLSSRYEPDTGGYAAARRLGNRFQGTWLGHVPLPLPKDYIQGIDSQKRDFEGRLRSYLRGETRFRGWWYYYLYGLAVKVPLGTWLLAGIALFLSLRGAAGGAAWRDVLFPALPALLILVVVSSETGMTNHVRYILPILPFAFIMTARAGQAWQHQRHSVFSYTAAVALLWAVASSLSVYPHSHSYFNELAGGPRNGHHHLLSSNIDYGEDLLYLRDWLEAHPDDRPLMLAYFGNFDPRIAGIEFTLPPSAPTRQLRRQLGEEQLGPLPGRYAVSVNYLHATSVPLHDGQGGRQHGREFSYLLHFEPVATVGYGIHIYDLELQEVNRVRRMLRLSPLPDDWRRP